MFQNRLHYKVMDHRVYKVSSTADRSQREFARRSSSRTKGMNSLRKSPVVCGHECEEGTKTDDLATLKEIYEMAA